MSNSEDISASTEEQQQQQQPVYNILLLGETGAGKSTSINAIANYLKFSTFEKAKSNEFEHLIPSTFMLSDAKSGKPFKIQSGSDANERNDDPGSSCTREPRAYKFKLGDWLLRIIDTPGMGDTGGVDVDRQNFDKILHHLHAYKQLHGIVFLIKSNETRKTAYFRYCITELLTYLHKSACKNIVFCFTFSRNSFYGPGEGFDTLKSFLESELADVKIDLQPGVNCFFIDNEAYRYLVAKKQHYPFAENIENSYHESWVRSVEQTTEMWEQIKDMTPHELESTCSLNNARKLILELAEPMVQLQNNINANIEHIKTQEESISNSQTDKLMLARTLKVVVDDLELRPLPYPTTVCTASKCTDVVKFQDKLKINYKTRCHENCKLTDVQTNIVGHEILKNCAAMKHTVNCHKCGCNWATHMHITGVYFKVSRSIIDTNKQREIKSRDDAIKRIESALASMRQFVNENLAEYQVIQDVCSKFAYILISNSNTPYNRFIEPYLQLLIEEEIKKLGSVQDYPRATYESLVKMRDTHRENVQILTDAIKNKSVENVQLEDIHKYRDQLFGLKHSGRQFAQIMGMTDLVKKKKLGMITEQSFDFTSFLSSRMPSLFKAGVSKFVARFKYNASPTMPQQHQQHKQFVLKCFICEKSHKSIFCNSYTPEIRAQFAKLKGLCMICLTPEHELTNCMSRYVCKDCGGKHSVTVCTVGYTHNSAGSGSNTRNYNYNNRSNREGSDGNWRKRN